MAARYLTRRRKRLNNVDWLLISAILLAVGTWWTFLRSNTPEVVDGRIAMGPPALTTTRPETTPFESTQPEIREKGDSPGPQPEVNPNDPVAKQAGSLYEAGRDALSNGNRVHARQYLSEALRAGLEPSKAALVRAELTRLGNETIFSRRTLTDDPLVGRYVIKTGDTLGKIARANKISPDLLAQINGITNKNLIRAGQNIKIINGPFHAFITKSNYGMDILLGDTVIKHFKVGLGADDGTPTGKWQVGTKLMNPTYYPPRSGLIIAADDPKNPLGERWIGLRGISGEAVGQERYGIHGTIEPESIGRSVSLGCIRLHNEDVELLYAYLVEKYSIVIVAE